MALSEREKANRAMKQAKDAEKERRRKALTAKVSTKAVDRQPVDRAAVVFNPAVAALGAAAAANEADAIDGKDILLKGVPQDMRDWLEDERERRGFRSRQVLLMAILTEARGGK